MKELIKSLIKVCLFAAIAGGAFFASPLPTLAQEPGAKKAGGKPAEPTGATVDNELNAIQARANAAAAKWNPKSAASVAQLNAELAKVHADFIAYAKANRLKVTGKVYKHKSGDGAGRPGAGTSAAQAESCPGEKRAGGMVCTLESVDVRPIGFGSWITICHYTCVPAPTANRE